MVERVLTHSGEHRWCGADARMKRRLFASWMIRKGKKHIFSNGVCQIHAQSFSIQFFFDEIPIKCDAVGEWFQAPHAFEGKIGTEFAGDGQLVFLVEDMQTVVEWRQRAGPTGFEVKDFDGQGAGHLGVWGRHVGQVDEQATVGGRGRWVAWGGHG